MPVKATRRYVYKLTLIATLGGFLFGYDTAVVSGAVSSIRDILAVPFAALTGWNRVQ
jgi:SP family xylose:H+ symportor-like MFS transporter